jgi:hypothetical protein
MATLSTSKVGGCRGTNDIMKRNTYLIVVSRSLFSPLDTESRKFLALVT